METGGFNWQGWIGAAILIGLLYVLIASLKQSAATVDAGREDLKAWKGGITGYLLVLLGVIVFMAFQNLALFTVITASLWRRLWELHVGWDDFLRYALPAGLSFLFYVAALALMVWKRGPWVPKAVSVLLWIAGPAVSIPAFALSGAQPGLWDFGFPSAIALAGTVLLLFSPHSKALYCGGVAK